MEIKMDVASSDRFVNVIEMRSNCGIHESLLKKNGVVLDYSMR